MAEKKYIIDNPNLMAEWDWEKNNEFGFNPSKLTFSSGKKVCWKCSKGHSWMATIDNRNHGNKCPICSGRVVLQGFNDLATTNPKLLSEWDCSKNVDIQPTEISKGTPRKVWWMCSNGHSWQASVSNRVKGRGCPECYKSRPRNKQQYIDLAKRFAKPVIQFNMNLDKIEEFPSVTDCAKRLSLSEGQVVDCCKRKLKTAGGYIFRYSNDCADITNKTYVPFSYSRTSFPEQAILYYLRKIFKDTIGAYKDYQNNITEIDIYIPKFKIGIEYDGKAYHSNSKAIERDKKKYENCRKNGIALIRVSEHITDYTNADYFIKSMYVENKFPGLDLTIKQVLEQIISITKIAFEFPIINTKKDSSLIKEQYLNDMQMRSLKSLYPQLAEKWDYAKNYPLKPENVFAYSHDKYYFICDTCTFSFKTSLANITKGKGCPICGNKRRTEKKEKVVLQYSLTGEYITEYKSVKDAMMLTNISGIYQSCNRLSITAGEYIWRYKHDDADIIDVVQTLDFEKREQSKTAVLQYTLDGVFVRRYSSSGEAERLNGISHSKVGACCRGKRKTAGGYIWKYDDKNKEDK